MSGELQPLLKQVSEQTLQIAVAAFAVCVLSAPGAVTSYSRKFMLLKGLNLLGDCGIFLL